MCYILDNNWNTTYMKDESFYARDSLYLSVLPMTIHACSLHYQCTPSMDMLLCPSQVFALWFLASLPPSFETNDIKIIFVGKSAVLQRWWWNRGLVRGKSRIDATPPACFSATNVSPCSRSKKRRIRSRLYGRTARLRPMMAHQCHQIGTRLIWLLNPRLSQ